MMADEAPASAPLEEASAPVVLQMGEGGELAPAEASEAPAAEEAVVSTEAAPEAPAAEEASAPAEAPEAPASEAAPAP